MKSLYKLLYIYPGPLPPNKAVKLDKFYALSKHFEGDILHPVWWESKEKVEEEFGANSFPTRKVGNFTYHFLLLYKYPQYLHFFIRTLFFAYKGIQLSKLNGNYDFIMSYGTNSTGLGALIVKIFTKSKFIAEIPGVPEDGSLWDSPIPNFQSKFRKKISDFLLMIIASNADRLKLLYETQVDKYQSLKAIPKSVFHDFVATETIESLENSNENYVLFVGSPWYRKGVDILIRAFNEVSPNFSNINLKIVGWFPDKNKLEEMINKNPRIELLGSSPHLETLKLIAKCKFFVLPSRSEAMGRVLLEAMAAKKAIIASNVNGIPTYVKDNFNGLLFESSNHHDLANKLSTLLADEEKATTFGENGYKSLKADLSEDKYVQKFLAMTDKMKTENNQKKY